MAETAFPGTNPFGSSMSKVTEEDENDTLASPTASSFRNSPLSSPPSSARAPSSNPFGGDGAGESLFGGFGGSFGGNFGNSPQISSGPPANFSMGRRTSVSAESMNPQTSMSDNWTPPFHKKTSEQVSRLKKAVAHNFLFSHLDDEQSSQVLGALVEKPIPAKGIKVITQGDAGDYFYVVEKGTFDIYINSAGHVEPGPDGMGNKVTSIGPGGSFGELALMYNAPRAATVVSTEPQSLLWMMDRMTFRRILMDSAFQRRRMYESFLEEVSLLSSLTPYERSKIADALETRKFSAGSQIITEGDPGEAFYLMESGDAEVYKKSAGDEPIHKYSKGDYFGELALLNDKPRAATVTSVTEVKVAQLGKDGFQRLLGPVEEIMRRNDPTKQAKESDEVDPLSAS